MKDQGVDWDFQMVHSWARLLPRRLLVIADKLTDRSGLWVKQSSAHPPASQPVSNLAAVRPALAAAITTHVSQELSSLLCCVLCI